MNLASLKKAIARFVGNGAQPEPQRHDEYAEMFMKETHEDLPLKKIVKEEHSSYFIKKENKTEMDEYRIWKEIACSKIIYQRVNHDHLFSMFSPLVGINRTEPGGGYVLMEYVNAGLSWNVVVEYFYPNEEEDGLYRITFTEKEEKEMKELLQIIHDNGEDYLKGQLRERARELFRIGISHDDVGGGNNVCFRLKEGGYDVVIIDFDDACIMENEECDKTKYALLIELYEQTSTEIFYEVEKIRNKFLTPDPNKSDLEKDPVSQSKRPRLEEEKPHDL